MEKITIRVSLMNSGEICLKLDQVCNFFSCHKESHMLFKLFNISHPRQCVGGKSTIVLVVVFPFVSSM